MQFSLERFLPKALEIDLTPCRDAIFFVFFCGDGMAALVGGGGVSSRCNNVGLALPRFPSES